MRKIRIKGVVWVCVKREEVECFPGNRSQIRKEKEKQTGKKKKTKAEESKGEVGQWKGDSTHPHGKSQKK